MKKTADNADIMNETLQDIHDGVLNAEDLDIDNFSDAALPEEGHHVVRIICWELVPEKEIVNRYQGKVVHTGEKTKAYISLDLKDSVGRVFTTRLYPGGVAGFMRNMAAQSDGACLGMKLSGVIRYFMQHDMDVWVRWDSRYGVQIDYYDRDERE